MDETMRLQTNLLKQIGKDLDNFSKRSQKERTRNYVSGRIAVLEEHFKMSTKYNTEGISSVEVGKEEEIEEVFEKIKETYFKYKAALLDSLDTAQQSGTQAVSARLGSIENTIVRLPKINIPTFTGDYQSWTSFHDLFDSLVRKNTTLTDVEKLHYLKSSLGGEAERLLQHLAINKNNYGPAWDILTSRYDHKRVLVNAQLNIFLGQESIVHETASSLKSLLDTSVECRHALRNLGVAIDHWDVIIIFLLTKKLPMNTQQLWEEKLGSSKELPKFKSFQEFLESRFRTLEAVGIQQAASSSKLGKSQVVKANTFHTTQVQNSQYKCKVCNKGPHSLRVCRRFEKMDVASRRDTVRRIGVCENCLAYSHATQQCPSKTRCYVCQQPHHTLLHNPSTTQIQQSSTSQHTLHTQNTPHNFTHSAPSLITGNQQSFQSTQSHLSTAARPYDPQNLSSFLATQDTTEVLLATTLLRVRAASGLDVVLRGLVDAGSEASFITEKAAKRLGVKAKRTSINVSGLGKVSSGNCHSYVDLRFGSLHSGFETETRLLIFESLTGFLPAHELRSSKWSHIRGLSLADPTFYKPAEIDVLLGADVYAEIVLPEVIRGEGAMTPIAQNTLLGWILMGKVHQNRRCIRTFHQVVDISRQLQRFWEVEEVPYKGHKNTEDAACEKFFSDTTKRLANGRYEVSLPFKGAIRPALGSSKQGALRRFGQLERRFAFNPKLHEEYKKCINEYLRLEHMEEVDVNLDEILSTPHHFFLPHHAVFKESSSTTKLRVVFDAAAKSTDGTSLNQHLMTGPKTQIDIMDVVLRWRRRKYTFTADIEKMYRQIRVNATDSYYQLIVWRNDNTEPIKVYRLQTVTFGTTCAPYLAIRALNQLAADEEDRFPLGSRMVREDVYVDDLFAGADTIHEALVKRHEVNNLLLAGGFNLRKWASNENEILDNIPAEQREVDFTLPSDTPEFSVPFKHPDHIKALGIKWYPKEDRLSFQSVQSESAEPTKRSILSTIAKLYDPLGWISPCIIKGKIMMQQLWKSGLEWDDHISVELNKEWTAFREELPHFEQIRIPRWIHMSDTCKGLELHGFSDASEKAYGAAVYLRVIDAQNQIHVNLLLAKTRVAPVKTQTLPRLELCGAVMLATLLDYTAGVLGLRDAKQYAWTDSMITLAWIAASPTKWATFVNHRVAEIQRLVTQEKWKHIPSALNPADLASRGVMPSALQANTLWWNGPRFLSESWEFECPHQPTNLVTEEETRPVKVHTIRQVTNEFNTFIKTVSNLGKLVRVVAYCRRFSTNARSVPQLRNFNPLAPNELNAARSIITKIAQSEMFHAGDQFEVPKSLCAFTDPEGILRIGGRLENAELTWTQQHPIILRGNHQFSKLLIVDAHLRTLHGGLQQTIRYLRNKYWILKFKNSVKGVINRCVICYRHRAQLSHQLMGNLPAPRVCMSPAFTHTGVDYAGPIDIKAWRGRNAKRLKAYFSIFICLATKAIHVELVSDLTTQAFIAALRRFTARRGMCSHIFSDNATNFVGANRELKKLLEAAKFDWTNVAETLANESIQWHFIPPASPHFGGLWEAGVKSIKHHLKRMIGAEIFTFEELNTLLSQIEACLNSRPLCPMTENPDDFNVLTPGHFLIGRALTTIPEERLLDTTVGPLQRWQQIQKVKQTFWKRWSSDYLNRLQQRPKWQQVETQPKLNDLVLIKEDNLPPSKWSLGRIIDTHPGKDELIRVVTIKTANGQVKRCINKICLLPSNESYEES